MTKYYVDGSGWNGKESKFCVVQRDEYNQFNYHNYIAKLEFQLTNNEAEYYALIFALLRARPNDEIYMDSQLIINQVTGNWKINYEHLRRLREVAKKIMPENVKLIWVPREKNNAGVILEYESMG